MDCHCLILCIINYEWFLILIIDVNATIRYDIDFCSNYCDLIFTSYIDYDKYQNNYFIVELSYPIILTIGSVVNQRAIFINFYDT